MSVRVKPGQERKGRPRKKTGRERWGWGRLFLGMALGACYARLQPALGLFPAGIAFCGAWWRLGIPGGLPLLSVTFYSLSTVLSGRDFFFRLLVYLPFFLGIKLTASQKNLLVHGAVFLIPAGSYFLLRALGFAPPNLPGGLGEIGLVCLLALLFTPGLGLLFSASRQPGNIKTAFFSLGLLALTAFLSLKELDFSAWVKIPLAGELFLALLLVFIAGRRYGTAEGIGVAVFFALVDAIFGEPDPLRLVLMAGSGPAAALGGILFKRHGQAGGFFLYLGLMAARWWGTAGMDGLLVTGLLTWAVILCLPAAAWEKMTLPLPLPANSPDHREKRRQEVVIERLQRLVELFNQIAAVFSGEKGEEQENNRQEIYAFIEKISERNCRFCASYRSCWGELFYSTYREIFDLIAAAEIGGTVGPKQMKGRLARECTQKHELLMAINSWVERQQAEYIWRRRYEEGRVFLAGQLREMAGIMAGLSRQLKLSVDFRVEIEEELRAAFKRMNLQIQEMSVTGLEKNRVEIYLEKKSCGAGEECQRVIVPLISQLLGTRFSVGNRNCPQTKGEWCGFYLTPHRRYKVRSAVGKVPRDGNQLSGDSHSVVETREGYVFSILSDGMGTGPAAARQSGITVSLLQKLLDTGLEKKFCLQLVNSLLLLRSPEENFATLDLFVFDQFTAETELIKIGAAPTYIKRGKEVSVVHSTSLPVGILHYVEPEYTRYTLQENDLVVMVTDGVIDFGKGKNEDWIYKVLKNMDLTGVDSLCRYLLESARIEAGGVVEDDMTVVVLQIVRENPAREVALLP